MRGGKQHTALWFTSIPSLCAHHAHARLQACATLTMVVQGCPTNGAAGGGAGAFNTFVSALQIHARDVDTVTELCRTLWTLTLPEYGDQNITACVRAGAVPALGMLLGQPDVSELVARAVLDAMITMAQSSGVLKVRARQHRMRSSVTWP